tara:strand:+ start:2985 stop:3431 length:447 start_codon:yes stop_codon:yes gene_type:complete
MLMNRTNKNLAYPQFGVKLNEDIKRYGKTKDINDGFALRDKSMLPTLTGPQRSAVAKAVLDHEQYMNYRGVKIESRVSIPICSIKCIRMVRKELHLLYKDLYKIQRLKASVFERVMKAQERVTWTHFRIKTRSPASEFNRKALRPYKR